jgi:positive regulator of sigma E activity
MHGEESHESDNLMDFTESRPHRHHPSMKYTVNRGSQEIGKFELADIQALMNAGVILPTDYFWFQGMSEWKPVSSLFAAQPSAVPQVVVPPLPAAQHAPAGQVVMTKEVGPSCPSCHSTDVIKAHAAYEASLQQHSLSAGTSSGFRLWAGGESINKVGVKCAPPTKPADVDNTPSERMATLIFGMVGITFSLMGGVDLLHQNKNPLILIGGLGGLGLSFWFYKRWQKQIEMDQAANLKIKNRFKAEMADYVRTWRCNKCGVMYRI